MDFLPISESAARQAIDSVAIFSEWRRAVAAARPYVGGMYFKREGTYEYLVKTAPDNRQQRLGRRSAETEAVLTAQQASHGRSAALTGCRFAGSHPPEQGRQSRACAQHRDRCAQRPRRRRPG